MFFYSVYVHMCLQADVLNEKKNKNNRNLVGKWRSEQKKINQFAQNEWGYKQEVTLMICEI